MSCLSDYPGTETEREPTTAHEEALSLSSELYECALDLNDARTQDDVLRIGDTLKRLGPMLERAAERFPS